MQSLDNADFPEALAVKLELLPMIFRIHMVAGALALMLVPLAYGLHGRKWHRWAGRIAGVAVVVAGMTAFPVALIAPVTRMSAAGFAAQGAVWLALLGRGVWLIRCGRVGEHRAVMLMMMAATSGAVWFRIWLGLWARFGDGRGFETFYALDAWLAWGLPLMATALWLKSGGAFVDNAVKGPNH
jgi:hypothetical protein